MSGVEIRRLSKSFGGVRALREVSFDIRPGEAHALCGENGAGKSTLIKILAGVYRPDAGDVVAWDRPLAPGDVAAAEAAGVAVIHQEPAAFPHLDAAANVFVGREIRRRSGLLDWPTMRRETRTLLRELEADLEITRPVGELSLAQRQLVAIARALSQECRLLILDEPTASLSERETDALFRVIRRLQDRGVAVLYVSHRLEELFALADRVTVLRDGRHVATRPVGDVTREELIRLMVGRPVGKPPARRKALGAALLEVEGLTREGEFYDVALSVRAGEILGLAGLVGAGRSELACCLFGLTRPDRGSVRVAGAPLPPGSPAAAIAAGLALSPEDRRRQGLALPLLVEENLVMARLRAAGGLRRPKVERALAERMMAALDVRAAGPAAPAETLSGGNQQKVVLGKWLAAEPRVLLLDEPTRGVDVGAKADIHQRILDLAEQGMATLLISSDLPELLALCDRIAVMREGRVAGALSRADATPERVLRLALPGEGGAA